MSSAARLLAILDMFDDDHSVWSAEAAARELDVSVSTAYRYIRDLCEAELLVPVTGDGYRLGPAILKYDRLVRVTDPLLDAARPVLVQMQSDAGDGATAFLSRMYREKVMCVLSVAGKNAPTGISYERGRPMPMFRGATSKIILAYLPRRTLKRLYDLHGAEIHEALRVNDWRGFLDYLREMRRRGMCMAEAEVDPGIVGIAAPVFDDRNNITASLTIVGKASDTSVSEAGRLGAMAQSAARAVTARLAQSGDSVPFSPRIVA